MSYALLVIDNYGFYLNKKNTIKTCGLMNLLILFARLM